MFDVAKLTGHAAYATMLDVLADWPAATGRLAAASTQTDRFESQPLDRTKLLAPVLWPAAIFCAGANFTDHMMEMAKVQNIAPEPDPHTLGLNPWHFIKASRSIAHPGATVKLPPYSKMVDWEAELVAVIGRPAKDVPLERALDYVAGYTIANDLSARDLDQAPRRARRLAVQIRLGRAEKFRQRLPGRALDRAGGEYSGPAEHFDQVVGQ